MVLTEDGTVGGITPPHMITSAHVSVTHRCLDGQPYRVMSFVTNISSSAAGAAATLHAPARHAGGQQEDR